MALSLKKYKNIGTTGKATFIVRRSRLPKRDRRAKRRSAYFLLPSLFGASLFFFIPFLIVIYYSFLDNPISKEFVGMDNYMSVLQNGAFQIAVKNTLYFSAIAVPLAVVLSLILALLLDVKLPFRTQFRTFFLTPMMVPVASVILVWQVLFSSNGTVNQILDYFGYQTADWFKSDQGIVIVIILFLWKNLGYNMILFLAALSSIPQDIIEVAQLENANAFTIFFRIKLRYLASTIVFVTIMSLINSFKIFREVYLLTTDYPFPSVYLLQHYMNNKFRNLDYQMLSSAAILMSLVMIVLILILFLVEGHAGKDIDE